VTSAVGWMLDPSARRVSSTATAGGASRSSLAAVTSIAKNARIKEGSSVNIDVTSPGATLALGLMYLQSHNVAIAARFIIPDTHFLLDYVRADFIYLRCVAKHLVMWDDIPNTTQEIAEMYMPALYTAHVVDIRYYMSKSMQRTRKEKRLARKEEGDAMEEEEKEEATYAEDDENDSQYAHLTCTRTHRAPYCSCVETCAHRWRCIVRHGRCSVSHTSLADMRRASSLCVTHVVSLPDDDFTVPLCLPSASTSVGGASSSSSSASNNSDIDFATLRQSYLHILSANCFAIGLKYAGTADARVARTLTRYLLAFRAIAKRRTNGGDLFALILEGVHNQAQLHKTEKTTLDSCLISVATGLCFVMCGSGDLRTFQLIRSLAKSRPVLGTPAGWHQRMSMCIGLLFLSGGKSTLDTSPSPRAHGNIAYLLIAFYPHISTTISEARYYSQIYRHLYVLAVTQREVHTIDVDTGATCYVPLEIIVQRPGETKKVDQRGTIVAPTLMRLRMITPCLLPPIGTIHHISVASPRFHALALQLKSGGDSTSGALLAPPQLMRIYVKRKIGFESYEKDPNGLRSILTRSFPHNKHLVASALGQDGASTAEAASSMGTRSDFIRSFSTDPRLLTFTHLFLRESGARGGNTADAMSPLSEYLSSVLYECMQEEKFFEIIHIYMQLFPIAHEDTTSASCLSTSSAYYRTLESSLSNRELVWSIVLLRECYTTVRMQQQQTRASPSLASSTIDGIEPINASTPFLSLPLAEGSADVLLSDSDGTASSLVASRPLLSAAFLDAILQRVDAFVANHQRLQRAWSKYLQRHIDAETHSTPIAATNDADADARSHPLLVSNTAILSMTCKLSAYREMHHQSFDCSLFSRFRSALASLSTGLAVASLERTRLLPPACGPPPTPRSSSHCAARLGWSAVAAHACEWHQRHTRTHRAEVSKQTHARATHK
jgi:hypothetical protein